MNQLNSTVENVEHITDSLFKLYLKPDFEIPDFQPGQYVAIGLPGEDGKIIKRAYSIASAPTQKEYLEFFIATVSDGALTPSLAKLKPGDSVFANKKLTGTFTLSAATTKRIVCIATGTGLAPYISMLRSGIEEYTSFTVMHGVRFKHDLGGYHQELCSYLEKLPNFHYEVAISREEPSIEGPARFKAHHGRITQNLIEEKIADACVYICGNPSLIDDLTTYLGTKGFSEHSRRNPEGRLILESYW